MRSKLISIIVAAVAAVTLVVAPVDPVAAGGTCYPSIAQRSGDYVTYSAWGDGPGQHRVRIYRNGFWTYGPWVSGYGVSVLTRYNPGYTSAHSCQVRT
jgi:hypothetical protein